MSVHHSINDIPTTVGTMVHYKESGSNRVHAAVITGLHTETRTTPIIDEEEHEKNLHADLHVFGKDSRHIENVPHVTYKKQGSHHWEHITPPETAEVKKNTIKKQQVAF